MWNKIHSFLRVHLMSSDRCIQLYNHHHTQSGNRTFPSFPKSFLMTPGSPLPLYFTFQMDTMTICPKQEAVTMADRYKVLIGIIWYLNLRLPPKTWATSFHMDGD